MAEGVTRNGVLGRLITTSTNWTAVFTVPAGQTVLLKAVHVFNASSSATPVLIRLWGVPDGVTAYLPAFDLEPNAIAVWEGWTALNSGDQLQSVSSSSTGCHVWAVGAVLPGALALLPRGELLSPASP